MNCVYLFWGIHVISVSVYLSILYNISEKAVITRYIRSFFTVCTDINQCCLLNFNKLHWRGQQNGSTNTQPTPSDAQPPPRLDWEVKALPHTWLLLHARLKHCNCCVTDLGITVVLVKAPDCPLAGQFTARRTAASALLVGWWVGIICLHPHWPCIN